MRGIPSIGFLEKTPWVRKTLSLTWTGSKANAGKTLSLVTPTEEAPIPSAKGVASSLLSSGVIAYINEKKSFPDLLCISFSSVIDGEDLQGHLFYEKSDTQGENIISYDFIACFKSMPGSSFGVLKMENRVYYTVHERVDNKTINFILTDSSDKCRVLTIWSDQEKALTLKIISDPLKGVRSEVTIGKLNPSVLIPPVEEVVVEEPVPEVPPPVVEEPVQIEQPKADIAPTPEKQTQDEVQLSPEVIMPSLLTDYSITQLQMMRDAITAKITFMQADAVIDRVHSAPIKTVGMLQHLQTLMELRSLPVPPIRLIDTEVEILQAMLG